jgi:hypothetical protein
MDTAARHEMGKVESPSRLFRTVGVSPCCRPELHRKSQNLMRGSITHSSSATIDGQIFFFGVTEKSPAGGEALIGSGQKVFSRHEHH